jgi:DNA-binding CsgD family transcriptional regulator
MQIYDFVERELEYFRQECNFSDEELQYFNFRAKHYSNQQIAIKMNVSEGKVSKLARSVKNKILKVI